MEIDYGLPGVTHVNYRNTGPVTRTYCPAIVGTSLTGQYKGEKVLLLLESARLRTFKISDKLYPDIIFYGETINKIEFSTASSTSIEINGHSYREEKDFHYTVSNLSEIEDFPIGRSSGAKKCAVREFLSELEKMCNTCREKAELSDFPGHMAGKTAFVPNTIRSYTTNLYGKDGGNTFKYAPATCIKYDSLPAYIVDKYGTIEIYSGGQSVLSGKTSNFIVPPSGNNFLLTSFSLHDKSTGTTHKISLRLDRRADLNLSHENIATIMISFKDFYEFFVKQIKSWTEYDEYYQRFINDIVPITPLVFRELTKPIDRSKITVVKSEKNEPPIPKSADIICKKCGAKQLNDSLFCHKCGTKIENDINEVIFCRKCGKKLLPDSEFCPSCGTAVVK